MGHRVLITARSFRKVRGEHWDLLEGEGCDVVNSPYDRPLTEAEMLDLVGGVHGAVVGMDEVTTRVIQASTDFKVIAKHGVGVDNIDLAAATAAGVVVTNTPEANKVAVAELTIALMLALARRLVKQHQVVSGGGWARQMGTELAGKTLGLIGCGRIGHEVAKRVRILEMEVVFYDQYTLEVSGARQVSLDELLTWSDYVSVHVPHTLETHHILDAEAFAKMKDGVYVINTARGGTVDETALYEAIVAGKVAGAALDVRPKEPPSPDDPLNTLENVILTPHAGATTREAVLRMAKTATESLLAVLRGERPTNVVNPEVYAK
ncbi:MAG: hydroxyacid dehydrogenase [Anaerolineales bacterium]|nr:MAG: hydroxyacid dehydrogenase [Anaerolineales bacterium]